MCCLPQQYDWYRHSDPVLEAARQYCMSCRHSIDSANIEMEDCMDHKSDCYHTDNRLFMYRYNKKNRKKTMTKTTPVVTHPSHWVDMPTTSLQIAWDTHSPGNIAIKKLCLWIAEKHKEDMLFLTSSRDKRMYEYSCARLLNISNQLEKQKKSTNPNWTISADNFQSVHRYVEETEKVLKKHGIQLTQTDKETLRQQFGYRS